MGNGAVAVREVETVDSEDSLEAPPIYDGLNLYQRLELAKRHVSKLDKDGTHLIIKDGKKIGEFDYISHDAVVTAVRWKFIECGITPFPTVTECTKDGNRTEMWIEVDFVCTDNPEDHRVTRAVGYGVDYSDKGPGKAYSYAIKSAYMKILMLNSGDDTQSDQHDPEAKRKSQVDDDKEISADEIKAWANAFNLALDGATDPRTINQLQSENRAMLMRSPEVTREYFIKKIQTRKEALAAKKDEEDTDE